MHTSSRHLLKTKRFLPLFIVQFLGAFNNSAFKNAFLIWFTYDVVTYHGFNAPMMAALAAGLFILPFFLFSAMAGQIADQYEKSWLTRQIKLVEILLMMICAACFFAQSVYGLLCVLFLMGTQATFFSPIKYSLLPEHLQDDELMSGNGLIEGGTFLSILLGTIFGGVMIRDPYGVALLSFCMIAFSLIGWVASRSIPKSSIGTPNLKIRWNVIAETWSIMSDARKERTVWLSIIGISWFCVIGATFLTQLPTYTKEVIGGGEPIVTLFLILFSVGIGVGSVGCNKLLRGEINGRLVPYSAIGISIAILIFVLASYMYVHEHLQYLEQNLSATNRALTFLEFFKVGASSWGITISLLMLSICGGLYIVPLYAMMQYHSDDHDLAGIIAANSIMNAVFMVLGSIVVLGLFLLNFTVIHVLFLIGLVNILVFFIVQGIAERREYMPIKLFLRGLFYILYKIEVKGLENYKKAGERVLMVANHLSFLDGMLLAVYLPGRPMFVVNSLIAVRWYFRPFLSMVKVFPVDPIHSMATKAIINEMKSNQKCVIFPEGRITVTGSLMKVYEGAGMIADKVGAKILPIRIEGSQYTLLSHLKGKVRTRLFPRVTLTLLEPRSFHIPEEIKGRRRRHLAGIKLYDLMSEMLLDSSDYQKTLFQSLIEQSHLHGRKHIIAEDTQREPINYGQLITKSFVLGSKICKLTQPGESVGVMLPNRVSSIVKFFALQAYGRVPVMLNFSTGAKNLLSACKTAKVNTVYTAKQWIEVAKLTESVKAIEKAGVTVYYLEDIMESITCIDKIKGWVVGYYSGLFYRRINPQTPNDPAVILFTSGSEGAPKGVVLSHQNIQANRYQLASRVDFGPSDIVFNVLPIFHSFGLTGGTLLPLLSGIRTFLYPSPLHYRIVPELIYDSNATILFGTETFLAGYAQFAHAYDFYSLRYVFAGAEKLKEATRRLWSEKYGVRIFEGYGATEASPVLSTNTPMHHQPGTVGRLLPGIQYQLEKVPGVEDGGKLIVSGLNIMKGYLLADNPGVLVPPDNHTYDTGDIVTFDEEGYITIKGRVKRFAKIAGEMVSLTAVETYLSALWPNHHHAVMSIPDAKKGEALVLVTNNPHADRKDMSSYAREQGIGAWFVPKNIKIVDMIPRLGSGKIDYMSLRSLIEASLLESMLSTKTHYESEHANE